MNSVHELSVLIVDDEPLARERLARLLAHMPGTRVAGTCANAREALESIALRSPDLLLLDIEMPGGNGFELLDALPHGADPIVIFVTAHDAHALRAFDAAAADYVLKPVDPKRLALAVERARSRIIHNAERVDADLLTLAARANTPDQLVLREGERSHFVRTRDIVWIEAHRNHTLIHLRDRTIPVRSTISAMIERVSLNQFLRVNRSAVVNQLCIRHVDAWFRGEHVVVLDDGTKLISSRQHGQGLHALVRDAG